MNRKTAYKKADKSVVLRPDITQVFVRADGTIYKKYRSGWRDGKGHFVKKVQIKTLAANASNQLKNLRQKVYDGKIRRYQKYIEATGEYKTYYRDDKKKFIKKKEIEKYLIHIRAERNKKEDYRKGAYKANKEKKPLVLGFYDNNGFFNYVLYEGREDIGIYHYMMSVMTNVFNGMFGKEFTQGSSGEGLFFMDYDTMEKKVYNEDRITRYIGNAVERPIKRPKRRKKK